LAGLLFGKLILSSVYNIPMDKLSGNAEDVQRFVEVELTKCHDSAEEPMKSIIASVLILLRPMDVNEPPPPIPDKWEWEEVKEPQPATTFLVDIQAHPFRPSVHKAREVRLHMI
jgi:hypothetical protein